MRAAACAVTDEGLTNAAAVVSYVLNTILFASPDFKCGCRCRAYSTPDGAYTFDINDVRNLHASALRATA